MEPTSASPSGLHDDVLGEEKTLGGSPAASAVNGALRALSRAARAFALYDSKNEAIRRFLGELQERAFKALELTNTLVLEVKPFELTFEGQAVYAEEDRERSLSFRLFRDGVRRLTLTRELNWEELLRLLEILSVRFTGVRQQEDDLVTLLTRAHFKGLTFDAVEGFVADEHAGAGQPGGGAGAGAGTAWGTGDASGAGTGGQPAAPPAAGSGGLGAIAHVGGDVAAAGQSPTGAVPHVGAPQGFDLPLPPLAQPVAYAYREVPATWLDPQRAEATPEAVPVHALRLLAQLRAQPGVPPDELEQVAVEVKDFLLADRRVRALVELTNVVAHTPFAPALLASLATPESLERIIEGAPEGAPTAPPELVALLQRIPGDHAPHLLAQLSAEGQRRTAVLESLLGESAKSNPDALLKQLETATPAEGQKLLAMLAKVDVQKALSAAGPLARDADPQVQQQVLGVVAAAAPNLPQATTLLQLLLHSADEDVRVQTMELAADRHETKLFEGLVKHAEEHAKELSTREAEAIGEAMLRLSPALAQQKFLVWAHPKKSLVGGLSQQARHLAMVAAAGLGVSPGADAEKAIRDLMSAGDEKVKEHCVHVMQKRRRMTAGGKPRG